ncbi:MAG: aminotransferase class IV [Anaerolineae bacterium]|nr:aminotransferase class IV [Anaerolineae bacterium]
MPMPEYVSLNGEIVRADAARVCVLTPALLYSFGVYESVRVERGVAFHLDDHLRRLAGSAALIELELPAPPEVIGSWVQPLLAHSGVTHCLLRILALGPTPGNGPVCALWPQEPPHYPPVLYEQGVELITVEGVRYLPQAKSLNTLLNFLARREASRRGAHEALLHQGDRITEGASSNFFVVQEGRVLTAPVEMVLPGVTRALVLRLARQASILIEERPPLLSARAMWQEAFITSTSRKVLPVTRLDGQPVGDGRVGPFTRRLMDIFATYDRQYLASHSEK